MMNICELILYLHVGGLYDYPSAPDWDHYVDQSNNTKVDLIYNHTTTLHSHSTIILRLFSLQYMPHYDSEHSGYALMIRDRPPTTYFWQRNPTTLKVMSSIRDQSRM